MAGFAIDIADDHWKLEVLELPIPVLVDFWAPSCPPCRVLGPTIEKLAGDFHGRVKVVKIDVDQYIQMASSLRLTGIPTVVLFQNGKEVERMVGAKPEVKYREALCQKAGIC